ncbi:MAG: HD domain-containing protein [Myxococcota bacterium]
MSPPLYGPRFEAALGYAAQLHFAQRRKGAGAPYIIHPLAVASLVGQYGGDEDQAIAALLHDTIEDCGVTEPTLAARFGDRVARMVAAATDDATTPRPPWRERKERHIAHVHGLDADAKLVIAADKLHNALSIQRDRRRPEVGETVWDRFSADREAVRWYYRAMTAALADGWDQPILAELRDVVSQLEA